VAILCGILAGISAQPELKKEEDSKKPDATKMAAMMKPLPLDEALKKARVNNKYGMLLRQIKVPKDAEVHKDFADLGSRDRTEYAGFTELPKGHWVYVYPYWYIFRDQTATAKQMRSYGPEQLIGPPDVLNGGDSGNAWCSLGADDREEWCLCEYAEPTIPTAALVYANYNPGAVHRVTVFKLDGEEVEVWKGEDPTPAESAYGVSVIPFKVDYPVTRVKVYLDSVAIASWNEVDTIGLRDANGMIRWPVAAETSTTWARMSQSDTIGFTTGIIVDGAFVERLKNLETEVKEIKELMKDRRLEVEMRELKELIKELKETVKKKDEK
jgi:hypothetical protein